VSDEAQRYTLVEGPKLTAWEKEPQVRELMEDFEAAKIAGRDHILDIQRWRELMEVSGAAKIPKIRGRSSVQPKLIRRQAEWRYSALTEPFLSSDKLFQVSPVTYEDAPGARQNELVLNWQFRTKLNRVKFVDELVRTDVDEGTVIVKLGWCRETEAYQEEVPVWEYLEPSPEEAEMIQMAGKLPEEKFVALPEELQRSATYFAENQVPAVARQAGTEMVDRERVIYNTPTVQILNPENVFIDPSCEGDAAKARFIIMSFETSKSDLKKAGRYTNLDLVDWQGASILSAPDHETTTPQSFNFKDTARKRVVAYEYWGLWDIHGTGVLVPIVATWIGQILIRLEENPFPDKKPPFVVIPYLPRKRAVYGEADAELLEDNQKILGAVTRGMIDLMARSANGQTGFSKGMLDPTNRKRYEQGLDYEFNPVQHPSNGLLEHKYPELPRSALEMVQLQNQEAEALTGVKAFSGGMSGNAYGDVAAGIRGMLDASAKREMAILRRLAQGMQEIGAKIIMMNQVFLSEEEVVRVTNEQFVTVRREDLAGNYDLIVDISTAEVDNAKAQDLSFMLQTIGPNMDFGIQKMIFSEIAGLKRMPELAEMIRRYEPQPDPLVQLEQQKLQAEIAKLQAETEKLLAEPTRTMAQARLYNAQADGADLDFVEQETGTKHARELDKQQAQAQGNKELLVTKALLEKRKAEETKPNVAAAIGYNELSNHR
jgi:hypothetical protein